MQYGIEAQQILFCGWSRLIMIMTKLILELEGQFSKWHRDQWRHWGSRWGFRYIYLVRNLDSLVEVSQAIFAWSLNKYPTIKVEGRLRKHIIYLIYLVYWSLGYYILYSKIVPGYKVLVLVHYKKQNINWWEFFIPGWLLVLQLLWWKILLWRHHIGGSYLKVL